MQVDASPDFISKLCQIAHASKKTHLILRDLRVVEIARTKQRTLHEQDISLKESRDKLYRLRKNYIKKENLRLVILYNRAVKKFNTFYPEKRLHYYSPSLLRDLNKECLLPRIENLKAKPSLTLAEYLTCLLPPKKLEKVYQAYVDLFLRYGGKIIFLPVIDATKRYDPYIEVDDQEFFCVCQAGQIRSPTMRLVLEELKKQDGSSPLLKVRQTHGVSCGYDPTSWLEKIDKPHAEDGFSNCFMEAFGVARDERFGKHTYKRYGNHDHNDQKAIRSHFLDHYYKASGNRQVYLTFWDTGFNVLEGLIESNVCSHATLNDSEPDTGVFKNITLVFIPEKDKISHFRLNETSLTWINLIMGLASKNEKSGNDPSDYEKLTLEERRRVFWTISDQCDKNEHFYNHLKCYYQRYQEFKGLLPNCDTLMIWRYVFQVEAFRAYYWRWSGLLQPIRKK